MQGKDGTLFFTIVLSVVAIGLKEMTIKALT